ncbi:MAG: diacylglycerol/polyprenol kinase family protein [Pseudomonadota bacterium]
MTTAILYKHEIHRKLIHLSSLWIPAAIYSLGDKSAWALFGCLTAGIFLIEYMRPRNAGAFLLFNKVFGLALRPAEKMRGGTMTGAVYMMLGTLVCLLFTKEIAVTATTVLMVADTAAAIVGIKFGKTPIHDKSLEGSVAFLFSGLLVLIALGSVMPHGPYYLPSGVAAIIVATFVELYSKKLRLNDNFAIPVVISLVMWALQ